MKRALSLFIAGLLYIPFHGCSNEARAEDYQQFQVGPFSGLNNADSAFTIPADKAQDLLNVDLSLGGRSIKKRKGYALAFSLTNTTSSLHGIYNFFDSNGNDVSLFANDTYLTSSISGGSPSVLISSGPNGSTYQCVDSQGWAYCANTARTILVKTDGATWTTIPALNSTGTIVAVTPDRLVTAGFSEAPNRVDFSESADFTTWRVGPLGTDPINFTITAPGSKITHLVYAFNRIMWFKDSSFGYILDGPNQSDWVVKTISPNVGTLDNSSVYWQGYLYFRGQDGHIYAFDGSNLTKLTRDIQATITASQIRRSNSWTQGNQNDFALGYQTPGGYIDTTTVSGSMFLASATAPSGFSDTTESDFEAGTLTRLDSTSNPGNVLLALCSTTTHVSVYPGADTGICSDLCTGPYYQAKQFTATDDFIFNQVTLRLIKTGSPSDMTVKLLSDSSNTLGTVLNTGNLLASSVSTSSGPVVVSFSGAVAISSGTKYWIQLVPNGTCNSSNQILWTGSEIAGPGGGKGLGCGSINDSIGDSYAYQIIGSTYHATGNLVSQAFDVGFTTSTWLWNWSNFTGTTAGLPTGTTVSYETQTSPDGSSWDALQTVSSSGTPTSTVRRYIRYKATFTGTASKTPTLNDVSISLSSRIRPSGTFQSAVKNAPNLTAWDSLGAVDTLSDGTITFYIRSSASSFAANAGSPSWTQLAVGAIPSVSTGAYFQIRSDFKVTNATQNPTLDSFTQNWFEGLATDKAYGTYHKDAIWWSVASGTGATTNNRILRYDLLNNTWLLYDIGMGGMLVRNQSLYFGSAAGGYVYKFGDVDNDNGSAINAYWKSKDFFGTDPMVDKDFRNVSVFSSSVQNSTMTVTYTVDASSASSYSVPLFKSNRALTRNTRNLPQGTNGSTFNLQFGNNSADQPFEVFGAVVGFVNKSWNTGQ